MNLISLAGQHSGNANVPISLRIIAPIGGSLLYGTAARILVKESGDIRLNPFKTATTRQGVELNKSVSENGPTFLAVVCLYDALDRLEIRRAKRN